MLCVEIVVIVVVGVEKILEIFVDVFKYNEMLEKLVVEF